MTLVIGAGPAGCAAAIALRRRGRDVTLLDRARFPRDKVCGDVLLPGALDTLGRLGLPVEELRALGYACTGGRYLSPRGRAFAGRFETSGGSPRPWLIVRRHVFDHWLLQLARSAGARVREGVEVTGALIGASGAAVGVKTRDGGGSRERIEAMGIVAADGASSVLARSLGALDPSPREGSVALAARGYARGLRLPDPFVEMHTSAETFPGCAWLVPTGPDECNVGVGFLSGTGRRDAIPPVRLLDRLRRELPALRERLGGARIEGLQGWFLPLATQSRRLAGNGWLLAGDAAAMIDPLTGHGIHNALEAGVRAGETLADAADADDFSASLLGSYETWAGESILAEARAGASLQARLRSPFFAEILALAGAVPPARRRILSLIGHCGPRRRRRTARAA